MGFVSNTQEFARTLAGMFPGFNFGMSTNTKHDHYADFGFPAEVEFKDFMRMFKRNGIAQAAIGKTISRVWSDSPWLLEYERDGSEGGGKQEETQLEEQIRIRFAELRVWSHLAEVDRRSMVGRYAALILRVRDGLAFEQPMGTVAGGLDGLVEIIPCWENQLKVAQWDEDQKSDTYGLPLMYEYVEQVVEGSKKPKRDVKIHPSRVVIWSQDGTLHGYSSLEPGYNDLITIEKIVGAGGEGFWKNAKASPVFEIDKDARLTGMAQAMGVKEAGLLEAMDKQVKGFNSGFDNVMLLQGITAKTLDVTLPSPENFFLIALQSFAASFNIPLKVLVGSQSGERASTEDAKEWNTNCNSRRANQTAPNILAFVKRLQECGIIKPSEEWFVDWSDLTEASLSEKMDLVNKMGDANVKMQSTGELVFTSEEMRAAGGYEPLSEAEKYREDMVEETDEETDEEEDGVGFGKDDPKKPAPKEKDKK